jgi:hypothetical protein
MAENYWLKMIGAADKEVGDHWIAAHPKLLTEVRFPKRPQQIENGDYLVYYATGHKKPIAITRAKRAGAKVDEVPAKGEDRWPWLLDVQCLLAIPDLRFAPDWSVLDIPSDAVKQKPYIPLTHEQYGIAHAAMVERTAGL